MGYCLLSSEKSIQADKELKKAQHYHFTGLFFLSSLSLSLTSKTLNNCPNIQSSINHQQHILQIQNTVCLLVFNTQQKDRWILSSDQNFSMTEPCTKATPAKRVNFKSYLRRVFLFEVPLAAALAFLRVFLTVCLPVSSPVSALMPTQRSLQTTVSVPGIF